MKDLDTQIQEVEKELRKLKEKEAKVKKASIILSDKTQVGIISLFEDLKTTFVLGTERYSGKGEKAFWYAAAYAANLGYTIKPVRID